MKTLPSGSSSIIGLLLFFLTISTAFATERVIPLSGPGMRGAQGEAVISDTANGNKEVVITVQGLKPNAVYTVWLVNMKPKMEMAGLGAGDYAFTSDARGYGKYTATVVGSDLDQWQIIKIAHHPDRNPRNMKNMEVALEGKLK